MPKPRGRKVQGGDAGGRDTRPWWERSTGGNFLKLKPGPYTLRLTAVPREREMQYGKQKPRPALDIATDKGTVTVGLQSPLAAALAEYARNHKGPGALVGKTLTMRVRGSKLSRVYQQVSIR